MSGGRRGGSKGQSGLGETKEQRKERLETIIGGEYYQVWTMTEQK
jgi:hypothetical protein